MTENELKLPDPKSALHMKLLGPQVPNIHPFRSTESRLKDIAHVTLCMILPLTPMLKFQRG